MRDLVRLCTEHRRELVETRDETGMRCPAGKGHAPMDADGRPLWEVWIRGEDGRLVARVWTVRRGRAIPEEWYEDMSRNYAAELAGRDPDGFTPEARYAGRYSLVGRRPLSQEQRDAVEKARQTQAAAEGRRQRLLAAVAALGLVVACVLGHPGEAWSQGHSPERVEDPALVPFDGDEPEPSASPTPAPPPARLTIAAAQSEPAAVTMDGGAQLVVAGEASQDQSDIQPNASLEAEAPIGFGDYEPLLRAGVGLAFTSAPGQTLDLQSIENFQSVDVAFKGRRIVGIGRFGDQVIETSLACEWAFGWRLDHEFTAPASRTSRRYGCGLDVRERKSRAGANVLYGYDDAVGDRGFGHVLVRLRIPVPETSGIVSIAIKASLGIGAGPAAPFIRQFDYRSVAVVIDATAAIRAMGK